MATFVVAHAIRGDDEECEKVLGAGRAVGLAGHGGSEPESGL